MFDEHSARRIVRGLGAAALVAVCLGIVAFGATPAQAAEPAGSAPTTLSNGVIIHWNPVNRQYEAPSAAEAAQLFAELQRQLAGEVAARAGLTSGPVSVERMDNGMMRARLPLSMLNLSVVRMRPDGSFAGLCSQEPSAAAFLEAPQAPAPAGTLEER